MITECSNCKYYEADFREEPCKSCISYRYFLSKEETIKAKAIKEFVEKLKQWSYESSDWSHGEHPMVVEWSDIEDVLDEMAGESNG